jgi:hypothetical protein
MPLLASQCECECKSKQWNKEEFEKNVQPLFEIGDIVINIDSISMMQHGVVKERFVDYATSKNDGCMWIYAVYFDGYEYNVKLPEKFLRLAMTAEDYKRKVQSIEDALELKGKCYSASLDKYSLGLNLFIPLED